MPAKSKAQQIAMAIAEHDPSKLYARNKGMANMTHQQLHDFASGSMKGKPAHVSSGLKAAHASHPNASRLGKFLHPKGGY